MLLRVMLCLHFALSAQAVQVPRAAAPLQLDVGDDGKQLKLLVRHLKIGPVCELWCYEGGPFRYGTASRRDDGRVVFVHNSGKMTATTTFTPAGQDRVLMDIVVEGPLEALKRVSLMGPCMQFWHSEAFERQSSLVEFARRCFLYTMRGPVGMLDTARGPMKSYKSDAPENNPPWTQWYVPIRVPHPGDIWAFGASGDRPLYGVVGVVSRDEKWLAAIACARNRTLGQGWHDCIHHVPDMQTYWDESTSRILHRSLLYVMPNDKARLLEAFRRDFSDAPGNREIQVSAGKDGTLQVRPRSPGSPALDVSLDILGANGRRANGRSPNWKAASWGGFVRDGPQWRMWAYPDGDSVELCVSLRVEAARARVEGTLSGKGWRQPLALPDLPVLVRPSSAGSWIAALMWEQSETGAPATGVLTAGEPKTQVVSVRGRLSLCQGGVETVRERWSRLTTDWKHSVPYRMPVRE